MSSRAAAPFPLVGVNFDRLATAISQAVVAWAVGQPQNVKLQGQATGVAGAGAVNPVTTKFTVIPAVPIMSGALIGAGLVGPLAQSLSVVVTLGIAQAFTQNAQYAGPVAGVSNGADATKVVSANAGTLYNLLNGTCILNLGPGMALPRMVTGLSNGISQLILTGTGVGACVGVPAPIPPVPSTGMSNSVVV